MARKDEYKEFTFDQDSAAYTDNLTGEALKHGDKVYATSRDAMYAGGAVLESTYNKMNQDGQLRGAKSTEDAESAQGKPEDKSSSVRGNVKN